MNENAFKEACSIMCDFIIKHKSNKTNIGIGNSIEPGSILSKLQPIPYKNNNNFENIFEIFKNDLYPYILNWQHPLFYGFFPSGNSYPSILGELLSAGLGIIGFSWASCPSSTELELFCIHEFIRIMNLPFLNGVIHSSSSESILISIITAKKNYIDNISKLVMYTSELAHSCVMKASNITHTKLRKIPCTNDYKIDIKKLEQQIEIDIQMGLIPFYILGTFGTTSMCSYDNLKELGKISKKYDLYFHIDAAYAGGSFIIRKYRKLARGMLYADSININCNKLLQINFDCTLMFYKSSTSILEALSCDPVYLSSEFNKLDMRNYDLSLSRRFRSLKIWFTLHTYGIYGLKQYIKKQFRMARKLKYLIQTHENRLEILNKVEFGLICIRIKNSNALTQKLYEDIINRNKLYMTNAIVNDKYFIRISINNIKSSNDIQFTYEYIVRCLDLLMGVKDVDTYQYKHERDKLLIEPSIDSFNVDISKRMNSMFKNRISSSLNLGVRRKRSISCLTSNTRSLPLIIKNQL